MDKLLKKLGFVRPHTLSEDELTTLLIKLYDNPFEYRIDKEAEEKLFQELSAVDGYRDYLRAVEANDIKAYFGANPEAQRLVKGAFLRTKHFRSKLSKKSEVGVKSAPAKLANPRYA